MAFKLKQPEPTEHQIQDAVMRYMALHPLVATIWRNNTGAHSIIDAKTGKKRFIRYGQPGHPDIEGFTVDGRYIGIEVKTRRGRLTEHQFAFLRDAVDNGCVAGVVRSVDDIKELLDGYRDKDRHQ